VIDTSIDVGGVGGVGGVGCFYLIFYFYKKLTLNSITGK
jgi:hypothetical protein